MSGLNLEAAIFLDYAGCCCCFLRACVLKAAPAVEDRPQLLKKFACQLARPSVACRTNRFFSTDRTVPPAETTLTSSYFIDADMHFAL